MMTFQEKLRQTVITNCDPKFNPKDILEDCFKFYVAEMLKENIQKNGSRIQAGFIEQLCAHAVTEFRKADLGQYQMSQQQYATLFGKTIQEILNDAGHAHGGEDLIELDRRKRFTVNKREWHRRPSGIITV